MKTAIAAALVGVLSLTSHARAIGEVDAIDEPASKAAMLAILNTYAAGDYQRATARIHAIEGDDTQATTREIGDAFDAWRSVTPAWITAGGPASADKRRLIAATVALEIARAHADIAWFHRLRFFSWACRVMDDHPTGTPVARVWYLLSVAVAEETNWSLLVPDTRDLGPRASLYLNAADVQEIRVGHLSHARAAFPDEPRFRLADLWVRTQTTVRPQGAASPNWIGAYEYPVRSGTTIAEQAATTSVGLGPVPTLAREFEALGQYDSLRADVAVHLGYLAMRVRAWDDALEHLGEVPRLTTDPFLQCISRYLRGWVLERIGRRDAAIAEYRLALGLAPGARSLSILLSVQLTQAGLQSDAYQVLDAGVKSTAPDPWLVFQHGDAWRIPSYLAQLREALQ